MHEVEKVEPHKASVNVGFKLNMGNYESMNVNVGLTVTGNPGEKAGDLIDRVYALVEQKLVDKFEESQKQLSEAGLGQED